MGMIKPQQILIQPLRFLLDEFIVRRTDQKPAPRAFLGGVRKRRHMADHLHVSVGANQGAAAFVRVRLDAMTANGLGDPRTQ